MPTTSVHTAPLDRARGVLPGAAFGTFKLPDDVDFVVDRGDGAYLHSTTGRAYVDHVLASGPMILGHARREVRAALNHQLDRGTTSYLLNETALDLAGTVCRLVPAAEAVKLVGDGSAANLFALRLARAFTGRRAVLKFEGGFHGYHDATLHAMKPGRPGALIAEPDSAGIPETAAADVLIAPFNDLATVERLLRQQEVAAIVVEPVQRAIVPEPGFLAGLRTLAHRHGALLIFDELVTGFRLALGGAQQFYGVTPDLCALGKILGGGLPLAAVAGRRDILELSSPGRPVRDGGVWLSGTLNGNPLSAAAGRATLQVLEQEHILPRLHEFGETLRTELERIAQRRSVPLQVIGPPCMIEPVFGDHPIKNYRDYASTNLSAARMLGVEMVRRGIFVNPGAKWYVSAAHGDTELGTVLEAFDSALAAVLASGVLDD